MDVYGVFQADMIGYSEDAKSRHISIINDYVNEDLTKFLIVSHLQINSIFPFLESRFYS